MPEIKEIVEDPRWFPYAFDNEYNRLKFVRTNADALRNAPFLDERFFSPGLIYEDVDIDEIVDALPSGETDLPPLIFHSAFCCSTLLASALDRQNRVLALKEPQIIMSLANAKRMMPRQNRTLDEFRHRFDLVFNLIKRRFTPSERIVVKLTNSANNLLPDALNSTTTIVLIYASLEDYLISVVKKGEDCRGFVRTQYNIFSLDPCALAKIPARQAMTFTDLQVAALVWHHQIEMFRTAARSKTAVSTLSDMEFLNDNVSGLKKAAAGLQIDISTKELKKIADSRLFNQHSKFADREMSYGQRAGEAAHIRNKYSQEIDATLRWAENIKMQRNELSTSQSR